MRSTWKAALALCVALQGTAGCAPAPTAEEAAPLDPALASYVFDSVPSDVQRPLYIDYDGKARLVGYDVEPGGIVTPGSRFKLRMYWLSTAQIGPGWGLFTHLLDDRGKQLSNLDAAGPLRRAGTDGAQVLGPSRWEPGKVYVDEQEIEVPAGAKTTAVTVSVGIWRNYCARAEETDAGRRCASLRGARLQVLSGPSNGKEAGVVLHVKTGWTPPPPTPTPASSAAGAPAKP